MAFGEELYSYFCAQNGLFSHEVKLDDSAASRNPKLKNKEASLL